MSVLVAVAPSRASGEDAAVPSALPAALDDGVVAGVSMRRLVEVCGTPCVHSGEAMGIRGDGDGCGALVHHAGHCVGYRWFEYPDFVPGCDAPLTENMVVTREPGLYFPCQFGVRFENNYRVTAHGPAVLFDKSEAIDDYIVDI